MNLKDDEIKKFRSFIFTWWETHMRDLPWRHTSDPYRILISEIMLQQTQVSRGLPKYLEFIGVYPTVSELAHAPVADVLKLWKGMGYNRRALYLHASAKKISSDFNGIFPKNEEELLSLPGLGIYTARAIMVFAFRQDIAMVDTNIRQIITHFFFRDTPQSDKVIQATADKLLPKGKSWEWHQALMDFGALELGNMKKRVTTNQKKGKPFKETNRYFRGRMLDLVRERQYSRQELISHMQKIYRKDGQFLSLILESLLKDGLIFSSKADIISLPE